MTSLDEAVAPTGVAGVLTRLATRWRPGRRELFAGVAVAGSALVPDPKAYALRPQTAYRTICGPANTASGGYTVFCCTITKGVNACPPGSFTAGWWKAADSSWCGGGYRYIVDCNARCTGCTSGCADGICDRKCWNCSCGSGSTATCDQRRVCCNAFRYGQCNTQVACSGGVHCRVVSCVAPYRWTNCSTTSLSDNSTAEHSAPCLPAWGAISSRYRSLGEQGSYLRASTGPERSVGDGRGRYVTYQGGSIYWTSGTGAVSMTSFVTSTWRGAGGASAVGYPTAERQGGLTDGGWLQRFERGAITDSASTSTQVVSGIRYDVWAREGREKGRFGYPTGPRADVTNGWVQTFQRGAITDSTATSTQSVWGIRWDVWRVAGREKGVLGFPTGPYTSLQNGRGWIQTFQKGAITDSTSTTTQRVVGVFWDGWRRAGREGGVLGFPTEAQTSISGGARQRFVQGGGLWALSGKPAYRVTGAVLTAWNAAGGPGGSYGFPLTDTTTSGGASTCRFEGGTITA
ncbi:MAG TPA: hypothetical protein VES95_00390 [Dermatophilaceae bacterium]|nr:hypothetical protein [Dermatophilaceae bacterium]